MLCAAGAIAAGLPGPASAAVPSGPIGLFHIAGGGGYRIEVLASPRWVALTAMRRHSSVTYFNESGRATATGIHAVFGALGRIDATFRPGDGCAGTFVGEIRFRGEEGFTRFDTDRVSGGFFSPGHGACRERATPRRAARRTEPVEPTVGTRCLVIHGERPWGSFSVHAGRGAFSQVSAFGGPEELRLDTLHGRGVPLSASTFEISHGMLISRTVAAIGSRGGLEIEKSPLSARLTPGTAPFSGSLRLGILGLEGSRPLRGDLEVSFPGRADITMTGKGRVSADLPRDVNCTRAT